MKQRHIVLGVTGSIAAYKSAELVRLFKQKGWDVTVVMTKAAAEFVGKLTFATLSQNKVYVDMFDIDDDWMPDHISLSRRGDVLLVAPCTANVLAKIAHGIADDLLTATVLASSSRVVVAPAMNDMMWKNPATQENIRIVKARGIVVIDAESGDLACGYQGSGRLASLDKIIVQIEKIFDEKS